MGRRVAAQAATAGHQVRALVPTPEQAGMLALHGADTVVWAAGAGASGHLQANDGDALIAATAELVRRRVRVSGSPGPLVVVSFMGLDRPEQMPPFLAAVLRV